MFQCHSPKSSHPLLVPQSPKDCSIYLSLLLSHIQGYCYHLSKFHIFEKINSNFERSLTVSEMHSDSIAYSREVYCEIVDWCSKHYWSYFKKLATLNFTTILTVSSHQHWGLTFLSKNYGLLNSQILGCPKGMASFHWVRQGCGPSVIRLTSFLWVWIQCVCPLMPSCNTYRLTWVSLTLGVGYHFKAAPEKCSQCSLPWTRGISSLPHFLTFNVG